MLPNELPKPEPPEAIAVRISKMPLSTPENCDEFISTAISLVQDKSTLNSQVAEVFYSLEKRRPPDQILALRGRLFEGIASLRHNIGPDQDPLSRADNIEMLRSAMEVARLVSMGALGPKVIEYLRAVDGLLGEASGAVSVPTVEESGLPEETKPAVVSHEEDVVGEQLNKLVEMVNAKDPDLEKLAYDAFTDNAGPELMIILQRRLEVSPDSFRLVRDNLAINMRRVIDEKKFIGITSNDPIARNRVAEQSQWFELWENYLQSIGRDPVRDRMTNYQRLLKEYGDDEINVYRRLYEITWSKSWLLVYEPELLEVAKGLVSPEDLSQLTRKFKRDMSSIPEEGEYTRFLKSQMGQERLKRWKKYLAGLGSDRVEESGQPEEIKPEETKPAVISQGEEVVTPKMEPDQKLTVSDQEDQSEQEVVERVKTAIDFFIDRNFPIIIEDYPNPIGARIREISTAMLDKLHKNPNALRRYNSDSVNMKDIFFARVLKMLGGNIDYKQEVQAINRALKRVGNNPNDKHEIQALEYEYDRVDSRIVSFAPQVNAYLKDEANQPEIEEIANQTVKDYITYLRARAQSGKE